MLLDYKSCSLQVLNGEPASEVFELLHGEGAVVRLAGQMARTTVLAW